ncbi:hypothetical protein DO97_02320 [Neosynechococcus sphagnicola sy1]|uniref:histidine kinase n=1 Tax=Neosynechococcus sphagnicola sy1 TaxID=1497020 RepID=A0A098TQQ7_9CYAN|nr:sensor histidine kinase [Neosynechococcus sphagnicola]KGF73168.1 hypothetical protein DO97_02320 [Neosynechococcus sphagnicola sy1]
MQRFWLRSPLDFRFLIPFEGVLLLLVVLEVFLPTPFNRMPRQPWLVILSAIAFGALGFYLPTGRWFRKALYVLLELGLIVLATLGYSRFFPLLYLLMVIRSCCIFELQGQLIVTAIAILGTVGTTAYLLQNLEVPIQLGVQGELWLMGVLLSAGLLFLLSLIFALLLMQTILSERQSQKRLAIAHDQLRQYALRIEDQAMLQERNRIARDIHDSLGHSLTALNIQLETALKLWQANPSQAQQFLSDAKQLGTTALQEVRQSVSMLRTNPLQGQSLEEVLTGLAQKFYRTTGVLPTCNFQLPQLLSLELKAAIYRIVQEALTNICKYAQATTVEISIQPLHPDSSTLVLMIQDNGNGFQVDQNTTGFGLQGMRERTLALGGQFQITSQQGSGCQIQAIFPGRGQGG